MDSGAGKRSTVTIPPSGPATPGAQGGPAGAAKDSTAGKRGLSGAGSTDGAQPVGTGPGARGGAESVPQNTTKPGVHADARGKVAASRTDG
jgi:hypothetical protein